ncbi:MAG: rane protein [Rhizobacter sp.]|nr:rane protein [Rhizobacter sp.]
MIFEGHAAAWFAVVAFGAYHGLNPAMGWPLAVANGLAARRGATVFATMAPLGLGHLLAMAVVLMPFALLAWYVDWSRPIRIGAGALVLLFGVYRLTQRRHPRFLARVPPAQLTWWSFLMATAHGAGLMLVPITLSLCGPSNEAMASHGTLMAAMGENLAVALLVSLVHTAAMLVCGVTLAWLVYRWLGLRFITRSWFNLDAVWALSLIAAGAIGCGLALTAAG